MALTRIKSRFPIVRHYLDTEQSMGYSADYTSLPTPFKFSEIQMNTFGLVVLTFEFSWRVIGNTANVSKSRVYVDGVPVIRRDKTYIDCQTVNGYPKSKSDGGPNLSSNVMQYTEVAIGAIRQPIYLPKGKHIVEIKFLTASGNTTYVCDRMAELEVAR